MKLIFLLLMSSISFSQEIFFSNENIRNKQYIEIPCKGYSPSSITFSDTTLTVELRLIRKGRVVGEKCKYDYSTKKFGKEFMRDLHGYSATGDVLSVCYYNDSKSEEKKYFYILISVPKDDYDCN